MSIYRIRVIYINPFAQNTPRFFKPGDEWAKSLALKPRPLGRGALLFRFMANDFKRFLYCFSSHEMWVMDSLGERIYK